MRLFEIEPVRACFEQTEVIFENAVRLRLGALSHGVPDDRVQCKSPSERLLDEVPSSQRTERGTRPVTCPGQKRERFGIDMIAADVSQNAHHAPCGWQELGPRPVDEK